MKSLSRVGCSALLAVAQLLVITHSAFVTHSVSVTGEKHHVRPATEPPHTAHDSAQASWCGEHVELKPVDELACTAAKCASFSSTFEASVTATVATETEPHLAADFHLTRDPVALLTRAPKASPPRLG